MTARPTAGWQQAARAVREHRGSGASPEPRSGAEPVWRDHPAPGSRLAGVAGASRLRRAGVRAAVVRRARGAERQLPGTSWRLWLGRPSGRRLT